MYAFIHTLSARLPRAVAAASLTALICTGVVTGRDSARAAAPHPTAAAQVCSTASPTAAIVFGRSGGNIRPFQVTIFANGSVSYQGAGPITPTYTMAPAAVAGLQRLAGAEGFWSMPPMRTSPGVLPDIAALFISVRNGCNGALKTVRSHGDSSQSFDELYATLTAATGLGGQASSPTTAPGKPSTGPQTISLADNGRSYQYALGQRFLLQLGPGYSWTITFGDPALFKRQINVMMIRGAQGLYMAVAPGTTTLTASGRAPCVQGKVCPTAVRTFRISLTVPTQA